MKHGARLAALVLALAVVATGCRRAEPIVPREVTNDDLRAMMLRPEDLPPGFKLAEEKVTTNEQFAQDLKEPETVRAILDDWGRGGGAQAVFSLGGPNDRPEQPVAIASAADRFADADRARRALDGAKDLTQYAKQPFYSQSTFKAPLLGDQSQPTRMFTKTDGGQELVVYSITFRQGTVVAEVDTFAALYKDDKGELAARLAKLMLERVIAHTK